MLEIFQMSVPCSTSLSMREGIISEGNVIVARMRSDGINQGSLNDSSHFL